MYHCFSIFFALGPGGEVGTPRARVSSSRCDLSHPISDEWTKKIGSYGYERPSLIFLAHLIFYSYSQLIKASLLSDKKIIILYVPIHFSHVLDCI